MLILSRMKFRVFGIIISNNISSYTFSFIKIYEFLWDQFADWYIEISKTRLYEGAGGGGITELRSSRRVLVYVLGTRPGILFQLGTKQLQQYNVDILVFIHFDFLV